MWYVREGEKRRGEMEKRGQRTGQDKDSKERERKQKRLEKQGKGHPFVN